MTADSSPPAPSKRLLIVSPSFPPSNAPDMQRVRMSLPHYRAHGWEAVVLAVDPASNGNAREDALLATVPADVPVHRCAAWSPSAARRFGVGNLGWRSLFSLYRAGLRLLRAGRFDLVLISTSQFPVFLLGRLWRARTGVPYVIDLQDPWRRDDNTHGSGLKGQLAALSARLFEGWSFRRVAGVMSVSPAYLDALRRRCSGFATVPCDIIGFGGSEEDLAAAQRLPTSGEASPRDTQVVRIVYTGVAVISAAIEMLFRGLAKFRAAFPDAARLRFEFIGTSYAPAGQGSPSFLPLARAHGVDDLVREQTDRVGHLEAIRRQTDADALLLLGSSDPAYSPSKLYPYYLSGKPILAIVQAGSVAATLLERLQCATIVHCGAGASAESGEALLMSFFQSALRGFPSGELPPRNDALFRQEYLASSLTARQCRLFDQAFTCPTR